MIPFKNHKQSGFTLVEIILALFVMASLLSSILNLQDIVFSSVVSSSRRLHRVFMMEYFVFSREQDEDKKTIDSPPTEIAYEEKKVDEKSSLIKLQNMVKRKVSASWKDGTKQRDYALIDFMYKKPETKDKNGKGSSS
jgi:prepilin-type N-terminal cleavage/methylation domain-containing protein